MNECGAVGEHIPPQVYFDLFASNVKNPRDHMYFDFNPDSNGRKPPVKIIQVPDGHQNFVKHMLDVKAVGAESRMKGNAVLEGNMAPYLMTGKKFLDPSGIMHQKITQHDIDTELKVRPRAKACEQSTSLRLASKGIAVEPFIADVIGVGL